MKKLIKSSVILLLGVLSLFMIIVPVGGFLLSITSLIIGITVLKRSSKLQSRSEILFIRSGIIMSLLALFFSILSILYFINVPSHNVNIFPSRCSIDPQLDCLEMQMSGSDDLVEFRFRNNAELGADFNASVMYAGSILAQAPCSLNNNSAGDTLVDVNKYEVVKVSCKFSEDVLTSNQKANINILIFMKKANDNKWEKFKGNINGYVQ